MKPRAQYLSEAAERRLEAVQRRTQGESLRQIAQALNVSVGAVQYMLKQGTAQGV